MPYPNEFPLPSEHSARLKDPDDFDENPVWKDGKPGKFRRTNDGKIYGNIKVPSTVSIIWGKLKGKAGKNDPPVPQALRFSAKSWTAEKAKKWLKDNGIKYIRFEPATGKEKQSMSIAELDKMGINPCIFNMPGQVEFAKDDEQKKNKIRLMLYDGTVVKHWYFGNLAFDLSTMKMAKRRNPILYSHDVNQRLAYSDTAIFEPRFVMEGNFLSSSPIAQEVKKQMEEGFPFEASLRFDPDKSKVEQVKDGETVEVNGHKLKGPGAVIRNAVINEGSVCVIGALKNTQSEAFEIFNQFLKESEMSDQDITKMTVEELTEENFKDILPDIYNNVFEKGKKSERDLFAELKKACGEDHALLIQCFSEGKGQQEALQLRAEKSEARNKELAEQLAKAQKSKVDPAVQEFTDTTSMTGDKFDESKATDEQLKEHFAKTKELQDQFSSADAYIAAVRHPAKK